MSEKFKAIVIDNQNDNFSRKVDELDKSFLGNEDVLVKVEYSDLNFKDAMILKNGGKLVKEYPRIPGIDFSGIVVESKNEEFKNLLTQKKITNKYVTIFFGKLINKDKKRLNISFVTKKKIGNAVKRNKIKRRLRNITNEAVKKIKINFEYSFLVIAKSSMLNNEYKIIKETLFKDFEKIK